MMFRTTLKNWLAFLAKWAIKKHKIRVVVVSGWYGTEISRELVYTVLGIKGKVRRINTNPWWDLSIPLAILGYKDKRRSPLGWFLLMFRSKMVLLFGKSNPHTLILNLNYADADTVRYWSNLVSPNGLLITNIKENNELLTRMVANTMHNQGTIVLQHKELELISKQLNGYKNVITIGSEPGADLIYKREANQDISFQYKSKSFHIRKDAMPGIKGEILAGCLAVAIMEEINPLDALYAMVKYPSSSKMISKLKMDLYA